MAWYDNLGDEQFTEDFSLPAGDFYAAPPPPPIVPIAAQAPAVVAAPMVAPAPSPFVSAPVEQPTVKAFDTGIGSLVAAPVAAPVYTPAPSPANLFGLDIAPEFDPTVGLPAFTSAPAPSPVQAPAPSSAAQAPATPTKYGYWKTVDYGGMGGEGGGQGYSQTEWVSTPDLASQYENVANYKPYEGSIDPKAFSWAKPAQSGADIYGIWNFDTKSGRETASEEYARSVANPVVVNPETGESYTPSAPVVSNPFTTTDKEGNATLDPSYGLKDVSGLVHGTMQAPEKDGKHITTYSAFFDPKTGKQVGNYATRTVEIPKTNWIENLVTNALFALPALTLPGFAAGQALMSGAKSASEGNVLGALSGLAGGIGSLPGIDPSTVSAVKTAGDVASKISALTSGDPLQQLGAIAGITGSEDLATASKAANTVALLNAAASGNPNAVMKLVTTLGPSAVDLLTGGPGAMTAGEADERKGVSEVTDLINNLAFAPTPSPAPAPAAAAPSAAPEPAPAPPVSLDDLAKLYEPAPAPPSLDDLAQLYAPADVTGLPPPPPPAPTPAPTPAPAPAPSTDTGEEETESEEDKEGTEAAIDALTKGADTAAGVSGADLTAGTSDQTVQDLLDAGLTGTGAEGTTTALSDEELDKFLEDISAGGSSVTSEDTSDLDTLLSQLSGEDTNKPSSLSEQAKFLESNVEDAGDIDQLLKDYAIDTGQLQGEYSNVGALDKDYTVGDTGKILDAGTNDLADQFLGGNLEEDYVVTDRGTVKSTYTGEEGTFDADGNWVPYTGGTGGVSGTSGTGGTGGTGGGTPAKTTTTTTPTAAKSSFDPMALFALSAMLSQQPETVKERENAARIAAKSAFGALPYSDILDAYNQIYGA